MRRIRKKRSCLRKKMSKPHREVGGSHAIWGAGGKPEKKREKTSDNLYRSRMNVTKKPKKREGKLTTLRPTKHVKGGREKPLTMRDSD